MIRAGYFLPATAEIYAEIGAAFDPGWELVAPGRVTERESIEILRDLDFAISARMTAAMIEAAPSLRLIQLPGVGFDNVDLATASARGVPVAAAPAGSSEEVAEHTMMLMLAVSRRLVEIANSTRAGQWLTWERRVLCHSLHGKRLGIAGMGRIGREVARRAEAFGMTVIPLRVGSEDFDESLRSCDYISLHCPLNESTRRLLDRRRIASLKPGAILITTARGELVDEAALIDALREGRLAGAGLDVLEREPPVRSNPLLAMETVVVTPHLATGTIDSLRAKAAYYAANIRRVLRGEPPEGLVLA